VYDKLQYSNLVNDNPAPLPERAGMRQFVRSCNLPYTPKQVSFIDEKYICKYPQCFPSGAAHLKYLQDGHETVKKVQRTETIIGWRIEIFRCAAPIIEC
jgi:hypothetical protein